MSDEEGDFRGYPMGAFVDGKLRAIYRWQGDDRDGILVKVADVPDDTELVNPEDRAKMFVAQCVAAPAIEQMALAFAREVATSIPRWIPVSERLPEEGTWNLWWAPPGKWTAIPHAPMHVADYFDGESTHWMPIPEPPK